MSVPIFLQGKLLGIEDFVLAPACADEARGEALLAGRSHWVTLLSEVLPRALLAELGLARILLGSSGGGSFLLVLPPEAASSADEFLSRAAESIRQLSGGHLHLVWASTENLGDWTIVRKRLHEEMTRRQGRLKEKDREALFAPFVARTTEPEETEYFSHYLAQKLRDAQSVGWSPEEPAKVLIGEGKHSWGEGVSQDAIPLARHTALDDSGAEPASLRTLASRATGKPLWGVLRGDVDGFGTRMRRLGSIEEHVQLCVLFKQFFAGELEVVCSMAEFWRKVTTLYSGGDDFAVYGSWDALLLLAREPQRVFHRFAAQDLKDWPGPEAKTITMSLALAPQLDSPFAFVYEEAGRNLEAAKSTSKDCFHLFDRTIEWKSFLQASETKDTMVRMVEEFGCPPQLLSEMSGLYRDKPPSLAQAKGRFDRPWRYHRRLNRMMGPETEQGRGKEFQRLRAGLIADVIGRSPIQVKLRPAGRVAVEWARLEIES